MPSRLDVHQLGLRLRRLRQERGWSVLATASAAGLSPRYVTEIEAGRANPTVKALDQLAMAYGLALVDMLPRPDVSGPRATVERILDRRSYEELETIARELELQYARRRRHVVALIGARASGKTTIGSCLAERMGVPFLELDELVEARAGMNLSSLFSNYGEAYYRQIEHLCLSKLLIEDRPVVLATGGSMVEHLESYDLLLRSAVTVWLRASAETLYRRAAALGDLHPAGGQDVALTQLRLMLTRRRALSEKAQLHCQTDGQPAYRLVAELVEELQWLRADRAEGLQA